MDVLGEQTTLHLNTAGCLIDDVNTPSPDESVIVHFTSGTGVITETGYRTSQIMLREWSELDVSLLPRDYTEVGPYYGLYILVNGTMDNMTFLGHVSLFVSKFERRAFMNLQPENSNRNDSERYPRISQRAASNRIYSTV